MRRSTGSTSTNFERDSAKTPTSFQTRAFPFQIDGLRGPGLTYVNLNFVRNFRLGGRRTFQARVDIQNLLNYAAYNNPITDPTNTNFGKVTTAVALGRRDALLQLRGEVYVLDVTRLAARGSGCSEEHV